MHGDTFDLECKYGSALNVNFKILNENSHFLFNVFS